MAANVTIGKPQVSGARKPAILLTWRRRPGHGHDAQFRGTTLAG